MIRTAKIVLGMLLIISICFIKFVVSDNCGPNDKQFLTTFHPHLDAFWLNTDDELKNINFTPAGFLYAMNQRNSKTILNSMLESLLLNPNRRYFVTQMVFLKDWYDYLTQQKKDKVKQIINNGQLQLPNGGWVQNDEAVCYYDDIIDQYTVGMNFLYQQFGYSTKIGWATDSFGHSHSQVALQNLLGIQFQAIERIDDRYIYLRKQGPLLQFYWQPISDSNNRTYGGVLTQVRHFLHQVNNLRGTVYGLKEDFMNLQKHMLKMYGKNKLFRFLGNDFEQFITEQFVNLEKTFGELNVVEKSCNEYKYGNPSQYLQLIKEYWSTHEVKARKYDFMPNWDQDRYWVGYYTTDPQLKKDCKDFSRLVNFHRKILLDYISKNPKQYLNHKNLLIRSDQLLAVLQHHDGITATSKTYIQRLFKDRMKSITKQIINNIEKLLYPGKHIVCQLYIDNNQCEIKQTYEKIALKILHRGGQRNEKIQMKLPTNTFYKVKDYTSDIFCYEKQCKLVWNTFLNSGQNVYVLQKISQSQGGVITMKTFKKDQKYEKDNIKLYLKNGDLCYQFKGISMTFGYYYSSSSGGSRQTMAWNKYGQRTDKRQYVSSGMYIMFNNGKLAHFQPQFSTFSVGSSSNYVKVILKNTKITVEATIDLTAPNLVDWRSTFDPNTNSADFFLRAESNVKENEYFYHDSNGYLVSKRKIGWRPDYDWEYKIEDKINGNTYPACSFFYIKDSTARKFVTFLDRARGVSLYDGALITNIERIAGEDGKGVGQTFGYKGPHTFTQKFGIVTQNFPIERLWQRKYDEPLIGFMQQVKKQQYKTNAFKTAEEHYLKYNIFYLNENEIVLRIQNLNQDKVADLPQATPKSLKEDLLNLNINFKNIKESFANGLLLKPRTQWIKTNSINNNPNKLNPLQIKSYRINFKQQIQDKIKPNDKLNKQKINIINEHSPNKIAKISLHAQRKRCF